MDVLMWLYYAAAGWYVSYALTNSSGPFHIFARLREWRGGRWHGRTFIPTVIPAHGPVSSVDAFEIKRDGLLDCIICLLPWVALILRLIGVNIITDVLAIAAVALWLHGYTGWRHNIT